MDNRYMLISVCDREILTEIFKTKEEAQKAMHEEMINSGAPQEIFLENEYDDGDVGFGEYEAYVSDGVNHANFDWLIVAL